MNRIVAAVGVVAIAAVACGGSPPPPDVGFTPAARCQVELPLRAEAGGPIAAPSAAVPTTAEPRSSPDAPDSRVVVYAATSLSIVQRELERNIGRRLATVRGAGAGVAGKVNYTVTRGPFTVSATPRALVVRTTARADAEICARGHCYASCHPEAIVRAETPLLLGADYRFGKPRVTATFTKGCKIRTLGGFLTVDVTPTIEGRVEPELRKVEREIARQLPDTRAEAKRLFAELQKPRRLPLLGCLVPNVHGITQAPAVVERDRVQLRFAVQAEPELRPDCDGAPSDGSLPALGHAPYLPDEGEVRLALLTPLREVAASLERAATVDLEGAAVRVRRATARGAGDDVDLDLQLEGDVCGQLTLGASPRWSGDRRAVELSAPRLSREETERVSSVGIDAPRLAEGLTQGARVTLPVAVDRIDSALGTLPRALGTDLVDVAVQISRVEPRRIVSRGETLAATVGLRGRVLLSPRTVR